MGKRRALLGIDLPTVDDLSTESPRLLAEVVATFLLVLVAAGAAVMVRSVTAQSAGRPRSQPRV